MDVINDNQKSGQQKLSNTPTITTLLYIDPDLLSNSAKEQLSLLFKFIKNNGNATVCKMVFDPKQKEIPCLINKERSRTYLTVLSNPLASYALNNRLINAGSYAGFINTILLWLHKEHPNLLELLSKEKIANNLPNIQPLINTDNFWNSYYLKTKDNENRLQDQQSIGCGNNPRGSIIYGGGAEASIKIKPLSNKTIII